MKCNEYNSVYVLPDFCHLHQSAYSDSILWGFKHSNIWISLYKARVQRWEWSQLQNMHLIAYIIQITILQSRSSKSKQLKKPPLYTRTKYCLILDLFRNKTHPDTQTRIDTITALVFVYHQLNNKRRWNTMYNTQSNVKNIKQYFTVKPISKANISKSLKDITQAFCIVKLLELLTVKQITVRTSLSTFTCIIHSLYELHNTKSRHTCTCICTDVCSSIPC